MSNNTSIEWTDATWNPVTGCRKISPGCAHCYAETFAERFRGVPGHPFEQGFDLRLWPERLELPLQWKKPKRIFVNSMSDLFHQDIPDEFIANIFEIMIAADWHIFQILTKRSDRMFCWVNKYYSSNQKKNGKPVLPKHIWLGVSVENQKFLYRMEHLQKTNARIRFISFEPLLGPVLLTGSILKGFHWVIVGGESGHRARPMQPEWVYAIQESCNKYQIPFFFKQWGAYDIHGNRVGKKNAGRLLQGRFWDDIPQLITV